MNSDCLLPMLVHYLLYFLALITEQNLKMSCIFLYYRSAGWEFEQPSTHCWESENQIFIARKNLGFKTDTEANRLTTFIWANAYKMAFLPLKPPLRSHLDELCASKMNTMHAFQLYTFCCNDHTAQLVEERNTAQELFLHVAALWKTRCIRIKLYPTASFKQKANRANSLLLLYCILELKCQP